MYRIYCNSVALHLIDKAGWEKWVGEYPNHDAQAEIFWDEDFDWYAHFEGWFAEKTAKTVLLVFPEETDMLEQIMDECIVMRAAGGVVRNADDEWLMIYRRAHWDLPKGMIEKGETPLDAAIREVTEETAVSPLQITHSVRLYDNQQACTYHLYPLDGEWALKPTYWFVMETDGSKEVTIQEEEDITAATWVKANDWSTYMEEAYPNIQDVMHATLHLMA